MFRLKFHVFQEYDEYGRKEGEGEISYDYLTFFSKKKMFLYEFRKKDKFLFASLTNENEYKIYFSYSAQIYKKTVYEKTATISNSFEKDELVTI